MRETTSHRPEQERTLMTLADLLTTLDTRGALPPSGEGHEDLDQASGGRPRPCQPGAVPGRRRLPGGSHVGESAGDPLRHAGDAGQDHQCGNRRNMRNNLRVVCALAEAHGLLTAPLPPRLLAEAPAQGLPAPAAGDRALPGDLSVPDGPRHLRPAPGAVAARYPGAGGPTRRAAACASGRRRSGPMRSSWQTYLGYLANICGRTPTWDDLFDVAQLTAFVRWQGHGWSGPSAPMGGSW